MFSLKPRRRTSHKGQNGRVLIIGGSIDYVGAPTFVGQAASATLTGLSLQRLGQAALAVLRSGADLVTIAAPEKVAWAINCISPDLITRKLLGDWLAPKHVNACLELAKDSDVVVIGNGTEPKSKKPSKASGFFASGTKPLFSSAFTVEAKISFSLSW